LARLTRPALAETEIFKGQGGVRSAHSDIGL
jgi:hypothetical protein